MKYDIDNRSKTLSITIPSDMVSTNSEQIRKDLFGILELPLVKQAGWELLQMDLTGAKMVDSTGLNLLVSIIKTASQRGAKVAAKIGNANVHRTFLYTRLDKQMTISLVS
jgi:anti-anti-sigma factor